MGSPSPGSTRSSRQTSPPPSLLDPWLLEIVGATTYARGQRLAHSGAVNIAESEPGRVSALVTGSRPRPYRTEVTYVPGPKGAITWFESECDCPVETDCKHGIAALIDHLDSARGGRGAAGGAELASVHRLPTSGRAAWEQSLTALLGTQQPPAARTSSTRVPLGLMFEISVSDPTNPTSPARVNMRPVKRGVSGRWVRSGISWSDVRYGLPKWTYEHDQADALRGICTLYRTRNPWERDAVWVALDAVADPRVWSMLRDAAAAGVELVQAKHGGPVDIATEPAAVSLDLTRSESLLVTPRIWLGGSSIAPGRLRLLGSPPHGLVAWTGAASDAGEPVLLGALPASLPADFGRIIEAGPMPVPATDEPRLFTDFVPRLRRLIPLESSDGTVEIPPEKPPAVVVIAEHGADHHVRVRVQWEDRETRRRRPLTDWSGAPDQHRAATGAAIDALLSEDLVPDALRTTSQGVAGIRSETVLTGRDTIDFHTRIWPRLCDRPDLITELVGVPVEYRQALERPEIQFGEDDPAARDWFDLTLSVTVDGEPVPFQSIFIALANDSNTVILPSGTYFPLDCEQWEPLRLLIAEARELHDRPPNSLRVDPFTASAWDDLARSGLLSVQARQWERRIKELDPQCQQDDGPPPESFRGNLRAYQLEGFQWMRSLFDRGLGGILGDDMGLGKTVQALALIAHGRRSRPDAGPFLVVAPTSVVPNWAAEASRFTPDLRVAVVTQGRSRRGQDLAEVARDADLVVTSYALFRLEHEDYRELPWAGLILDEAQFVKNHQSKAFRCAKTLRTGFKLAVTGTPLENNLMEFWSLLSVTAPGLFPDPKRFTDFYRTPIERGTAPERLELLRRRVRPFLLRRTKEDVAKDLPPKQEQVVELELNTRHQQIYQRHLQRERQKILGLLEDGASIQANRFAILRSLTLLRQLSLDPGLIDDAYDSVPSTKLDAVLAQLQDIVAGGHRVLVFSQFTRFLTRAEGRLRAAGIDYCRLDGRTRKRAQVIDRFRSGAAPVFLISLKAGGFGLNLTKADYCILLDPWWNPAAEAQAVDRTHRIGQERTVMVYRYVSKATIEEKVMDMKAGKEKLFDAVLGQQSGGTGKGVLTAAQIRELIA